MASLSTLDIESLRTKSGLNDATIAAMGIEHLERDDLVGVLGRNDFEPGETGYKIPYFDINGNPVKEFNVRLHKGVQIDDNGKQKSIKYLRPSGCEVGIYYPPGFLNLFLNNPYVIITEGEKKAAKMVQEGIPCVAIAGVWNWAEPTNRKKEKDEGVAVSYMTQPLPGLIDIAYKKKIILAFDSDAKTNNQVKKALYLLSDALLYQTNGWIRQMEVPGDPFDADNKWGLDDWLVQDLNGKTDCTSAINDTLKLPSSKMLPLLSFKYATSSLGKPLCYWVPNCPKDATDNIHSIYKDIEAEDDAGAPKVTKKKISGSRLWVNRTIFSIDDNNEKFEMAYIPASRNEIKYLHGAGDMITFSSKGTAELYASMGCPILTKERPEMEEFFRDCLTYGTRSGCVQKNMGTQRRGWVEIEDRSEGHYKEKTVYVLPHQVIEEGKKVSKRSQDAALVPLEVNGVENKDQFLAKGNENLWRETMVTYIVPTLLPLMYVSASLAGMLRHWTNSENFIFHIYAESSKGKTIAMRAAESIWGDPNQLEVKWRMTDNGLESRCLSRNDMALFLDEAGQGNEDVLRNSVYMIGNATEKVRASRDGGERKSKRFRLIALSSGERAILKGNRHAGQEVRVLDIPVGALGSFWERTINTAEVADATRDIFEKNFGWGAEKAVQMILNAEKEHPKFWQEMHQNYTEVLRSTMNKKSTPQHIVRRASHYGLILTAMTLFLKVLDVDDQTLDDRIQEVTESISKNLLQMSSDQFGAGETVGMLEEFTNALASQRALHFYYNGERPRSDMWGSVNSDDNSPRFFNIIPAYMQKLCGEFDPARIIQMLDKIDALIYNKDSTKRDKKKSCRIDGQTVSCYCVDMKRVQAFLEEVTKESEKTETEEEGDGK